MNKIAHADIETAVKKRAAKKIALGYLGITSLVVTFPYGQQLASKILPEWIAWLPALLVSLAIYRFIDGDLSDNLSYIEKTTGTGNSANRRRKLAQVAAFLLLVATASFTYVGNYFVANTAIAPPDIEELKEGEADNLKAYSDKTEKLSASLSEAKRDLSEAKREGHKLVEKAKYSSNPEWGKRFGPHISYAESQKAKKKLSGAFAVWYNDVRQAQADSSKLVGEAMANLSEAKKINLSHLSVTQDTLNGAIDKAFLSNLEWSNTLRQKFTTFLVFTDGVAAIVIYFAHVWLCFFFRDGGAIPESRASWQYHIDKFVADKADAVKQRWFPAEIIEIPATPSRPTAPPDMMPVKAIGGDSYELKRRQEMLEARLERESREREAEQKRQEAERKKQAEQQAQQEAEERRRQMERQARLAEERARQEAEEKRRLSEELARQKAEAARQIEELQKKAEAAAAAKPPTRKPKSLSDKQSGKLSADSSDKIELVGGGVSVGGELYTFDKLSKFVDLAQKWYNRQYTSATRAAQAKNADKWKQAAKALKAIGCKITPEGEKVSIDTSGLKVS